MLMYVQYKYRVAEKSYGHLIWQFTFQMHITNTDSF